MSVAAQGDRGWVDLDRLATWFRVFAETEVSQLPLYRALSTAMSEDRELLEVMSAARPGQWRPVLFFAALHHVVLTHPDDDLSSHYPTVTGRPAPSGDPVPALRRFLADHGEEVRSLVATRSTQTNEVNRTCLWFAALRHAASDPAASGRPIAVVELGASAGFNLHVEEYRYDFGDGVVRGDPDSAVDLRCELVGDRVDGVRRLLDAPLPRIVERIGIDLDPVDPSDADQTGWLRACVWPEQLERHHRLDAALAHARTHQVRLVRDDVVDGIADAVDSCPDDTHVVVVNSWVLTYLERPRRAALATVLDLIGTGRMMTWCSAEGPGVDPSVIVPEHTPLDTTVVGMTRWRDGARQGATSDVIALCHPHLRWLDWRA